MNDRCLIYPRYLAALILSIPWGLQTLAQLATIPAPEFWSTDGPVHAITISSDTVYLGGNFGYVGPRSGPAAVVNLTTAEVATGFPKVAGTINTAVPDGQGGWYIGGTFTDVGGIPLANLAHVMPGGFVDTLWAPSPNGAVSVMLAVGNGLYVGGAFTRIANQGRARLASFDTVTGALTTWNPAPNNTVTAMTANADTLLVGGNFTSIGTMNRTRIAAFDLTTLQLRNWSSSVNAAPEVLASSATKNLVYLGGAFITVGGLPRNRIAAISTTDGSVLPWNPNAAGAVRAIAVVDDTIYAGGVFTSIGGQTRNRIAALDAATGQATSWNPNANGAVESILVASESSPHRLFVGGAFSQIGGGGRLLAAELDVVTGTATGWHPRASGLAAVATAAVTTLVKSGETLFLGGSFRSLGGAVRNNIAALDRISGAATAWNPDADGVVMALAHSPNGIYAGGTFIKMGGVERNRAALIGLGSGQPLSWNPNLTISSTQIPSVQSIAVTSTQVFLGGLFQRVGGTVRPHLAAVEPVGGQLIAWNPAMTFSANVTVSSLLLANDLLYVGGAFGAIGGQTRANLAALSPTTALATAWNPSANAAVDVIVLHPSGLHAGGRFTRVGGQLRNLVAGLDTATGLATGWDAAAPGTVASRVYGLGFLAGRIHVGGQFATIGGQNRARLGQLETSIGQATDWNPSVDNICRVIQTVPEGVFVGGDFTTVNGAPHGYFVVFPNRPVFPSGSSKFTPPGSFQSVAPGGEGGPRSIQASEDGGRTWRDIDVVWAADGFAFTDPEADLASSRFYRAVLHVAP